MKILTTNIKLYRNALDKLEKFGHNPNTSHNQFQIICKCKSRADANRQCEALGLGSNVFCPDFTSESSNEEAFKIAENVNEKGVFIRFKTKDGFKWINAATWELC